jgi:hypothetical protein
MAGKDSLKIKLSLKQDIKHIIAIQTLLFNMACHNYTLSGIEE